MYFAVNEISTKPKPLQYIIESVVKELAKDPTKKFIQVIPSTSALMSNIWFSSNEHLFIQKSTCSHYQVETGFFWRWWEEKDEFMRNLTRTLVQVIFVVYVVQHILDVLLL